VTAVESSDQQHLYQLVLSHSTKDSEVTCIAELLQIDSHYNISAYPLVRAAIHRGSRLEGLFLRNGREQADNNG